MLDGLWRQREVILAESIASLCLIANLFIRAQLHVGLVRVLFSALVLVLIFIEGTEGLKARLVVIEVIVSVLELVDVADIGEIFPIDELGTL